MPLPTWPGSVPYQVRRGDWAMPEPYIEPLETDMDGGNTRERPQPGGNVAKIQQTLRLTPAQHDDFFAWLRGTLNSGTSRFTGNVWTGTAYEAKTMQFVKPHPTPSTDRSLKIPVAMTLKVYGM